MLHLDKRDNKWGRLCLYLIFLCLGAFLLVAWIYTPPRDELTLWFVPSPSEVERVKPWLQATIEAHDMSHLHVYCGPAEEQEALQLTKAHHVHLLPWLEDASLSEDDLAEKLHGWAVDLRYLKDSHQAALLTSPEVIQILLGDKHVFHEPRQYSMVVHDDGSILFVWHEHLQMGK